MHPEIEYPCLYSGKLKCGQCFVVYYRRESDRDNVIRPLLTFFSCVCRFPFSFFPPSLSRSSDRLSTNCLEGNGKGKEEMVAATPT